MTRLVRAVIFGLPCLFALAVAQDPPQPPVEAGRPAAATPPARSAFAGQFEFRDTDKDGRLSRDEYIRPALGGKWEQAAREESVRHDLDGDGFLTPAEFVLAPGAKATPEEVFAVIDADGDDWLTREEFLGRATSDVSLWARAVFFRADADEDERLSLDEYRNPQKMSGTLGEFRFRDWDEDGELTPEEYVRPALGGEFEAAAKAEVVRFDSDRDGVLSLIEFALAPSRRADATTMFRLLDANSDEALDYSEFSQRHPPGYGEASRLEFAHFDADVSGRIEQEEYQLRSDAVAGSFVQRFSERDSDGDGRLSREEYVRPNIGGQWEDSAKQESVRYDVDDDGFFTAAEFARTPPAEASPVMRFALGDVDRNGSLDRGELAGLFPQVDRTAVGAWLLRYDQNDDRRITAAEWSREGWERDPVADPVADRMEAGLAAFRAVLAEHDRNADGELDATEWSNVDLVRVKSGLVKIPQRVWDRDGSGGVGEDEARWLLEIAWGLGRPSGEPYRRATGHVFNWDYIRKLDQNGDAALSREEFIEVHGAGRERNVVIFDEMDTNHDGDATFAELTAAPHFAYDTLWGFSQLDVSGDGRIDQAELDATSRAWEKFLAPYLIAAFDDDGDGLLNLDEFRLTPLANPYTDWYSPRRDANYDGRLSWKEYYHDESPQFIGLYAEYYRRFDRDRDGLLAPQELEFRVDLAKVSPEVAFTVQDKDGDDRITFAEVFTEPKPAGDARKLQEYQLRLIRAEESFLTGDADGDGAINAAEFQAAREHAAAAAVLGPAGTPATIEGDQTNWLMIGFLTLDALVLVGIGVWVFRSARGRA